MREVKTLPEIGEDTSQESRVRLWVRKSPEEMAATAAAASPASSASSTSECTALIAVSSSTLR